MKKISLYEILNNYNSINSDFYNRILQYDSLIEDMDGFWFNLEKYNAIGNFFYGYNEINEQLEGYISIFIKSFKPKSTLSYKSLFEELNEFFQDLKEKYNADYVYVQFIFESQKDIDTDEIKKKILNYKLISYNVKKQLKKGEYIHEIKNGLTIRPANLSDSENILQCLEEAYESVAGPDIYSKIGKKKFLSNVRNYHSPIISDKKIVLVAEMNGVFSGHITIDLYHNSLFTDDKTAFLVDIFVLKEFRGMGIGRALTEAGEAECYVKGVEKIIGTINLTEEDDDRHLNILNDLLKQGWEKDSVIYKSNH